MFRGHKRSKKVKWVANGLQISDPMESEELDKLLEELKTAQAQSDEFLAGLVDSEELDKLLEDLLQDVCPCCGRPM